MTRAMFSSLIYLMLLTAIYEVRYTSGDECNQTEIQECIWKQFYYGQETFPNYGGDEKELDETCREIEKATVCPYGFDSCGTDPACDEKCQALFRTITDYKILSFLPHLFIRICQGPTLRRLKYLEHASCLREAAPLYMYCHMTSILSMNHVSNNRHLQVPGMKCCIYSWMLECYNSKTSEKCGADAAILVSELFNTLNDIQKEECVPEEKCDNIPLPGQPFQHKFGNKYESSSFPSQNTGHPLDPRNSPLEPENMNGNSGSARQNNNGRFHLVCFVNISSAFMIIFAAFLLLN